MKSFYVSINLLLAPPRTHNRSLIIGPPPPGASTLKLNVDGSFLSSNNIGGIGGVLRDEMGEFIAGFSYKRNFVSSPQHIELLAIKEGILFLQVLEISNITLDRNCLLAVQAIQSKEEDCSFLGSLVEDIKDLLKASPTISVHHASRTTNFVVHRLASFSYESNVQQEWFSIAPDFILDAFMYDFGHI